MCLSVCLSVSLSLCMCVVKLSHILTKLGTHYLCANIQKTGTDFRNFDFRIFGDFLSFKFGLSLCNSSSGAT